MAAESAVASSSAVRRLRRDLEILQRSRNPQIAVTPSQDKLLEWHFVLHSLPEDTPYHSGCYHGKILFPPQYPHAPPAILMLTPSGRLEVGRRLCLSMTDFHPESWNPAWSVETILVGLLSFFVNDREKGYGAVEASEEKRRQLAEMSWTANAASPEFVALFPEYVKSPTTSPEEVRPDVGVEVAVADQGQSADLDPENASPASADPEADVPEAAVNIEAEAEDEAPTECWICRDNTSDEPLIQPCACRGSMSGVHASCVEEWIRHHRRNAVNDEIPCCSVCHQPYRGYEQRPGIAVFVRQKCFNVAIHLLRALVMVLCIVAYQVAAANNLSVKIPLVVRIPMMAVFAIPAVHKLTILLASLPPHRPPPEHRFLLLFFIADYRQLALHIAEALSAFMILTFWCAFGMLPFAFFAPVLFIAIILFGKFCTRCRQPSLPSLKRCCMHIGLFIASPFILIWFFISLLRNYPGLLLHPLSPGPHLFLALAVVPLAFCSSNLPMLVLWGIHAAFVLTALFEQQIVRKLTWREGPLWWFAPQFALLASYISNMCIFPAGIGNARQSELIVLGSSTVWFLLVLGLTLSTNRRLCVQYYRTWQHRHGTFTLQVVPAEEVRSEP